MVARWRYIPEVIISTLVLSFTFTAVLLCTCTIYIGMQRNFVFLAFPAFVIACLAVALIQTMFAVGCAFFSDSNSLITKWKREARLYKQGDISKIRMCKIVKSLQFVSIPAGNVGIVDRDIKMNFMDSLLQNIVGVLLTLKDVFP